MLIVVCSIVDFIIICGTIFIGDRRLMMSFISIIELQTLTGHDFTADHSTVYLEGILNVVSEHITAYALGTLFAETVITDERIQAHVHGRTNQLKIRVKHIPLVSVESVKYRIGATDTTIDIDEADLDKVDGYISLLWYGPLWRVKDLWITVTSYTAGHSTVPDMVKMATALLAQEWVDSDDKASGGTVGVLEKYSIGNYSEQYSISNAESGNLGLGSSRSRLAAQMLGKYRRPGVK